MEHLTLQEYGYLREILGVIHARKESYKGILEEHLLRSIALKLKDFVKVEN